MCNSPNIKIHHLLSSRDPFIIIYPHVAWTQLSFSAAWLFSAHTHRAEQLTWIRIRSNPTGKWETDVATKGFSMRKVSPTVHPMLMSMLWSLFATKVISTTWCDLPLAWWQTKNDDGSSKPRVFLCLTSSIFSTFLLRINFRRVFFFSVRDDPSGGIPSSSKTFISQTWRCQLVVRYLGCPWFLVNGS